MYKDMQKILAAVARGDLSPDEAESLRRQR